MTEEILVLGATGKTGRRVVGALETANVAVRKASRATGFDWADPTTWKPFLDGATAAYVIAPEDPAAASPFVELAAASGLSRLVLLSGRGLDRTPPNVFRGMHAAEKAVRESDLSWTILRANNFTQNFSEEIWQQDVQAGRLALPVDDTPEPFVDVHDIAEVAALTLRSPEHHGQTYDLTGPEGVTFEAAVAKIAAATGTEIELVRLTPAAYREVLLSHGLPEEVATELNGMFEAMRNGLLATPADDVTRLLGRPAKSFDAYVSEAWR
ncbi:NAD(P)H-binding protein [Lentzea sp. NBRC 102530]|uniref:NmrA family NAD(P)-binding protein n=1 Tax=Lentzea sp. NBRC 102530 TaxID=3032201 RepID=UPI0024A51899|nr:NAD(P)H-binding protein [Lentzea sp. NBRC 102530]GLY49061.1 NmrA family transcriptional regulator [Lentzea sp. NBRC 102530]